LRAWLQQQDAELDEDGFQPGASSQGSGSGSGSQDQDDEDQAATRAAAAAVRRSRVEAAFAPRSHSYSPAPVSPSKRVSADFWVTIAGWLILLVLLLSLAV
jgi:hypothetical protein